MEMYKVVSTNIDRIGYDNGDLIVDFLNGGTYIYSGVPYRIFELFMAAPSKGKFLRNQIIPFYKAKKISR